ncbi:MAG: hypothetical protein JSS28_11350 [Proteobacteria bacterium]|nr:hypothetical protein [Pseudomonadota bacterium]
MTSAPAVKVPEIPENEVQTALAVGEAGRDGDCQFGCAVAVSVMNSAIVDTSSFVMFIIMGSL